MLEQSKTVCYMGGGNAPAVMGRREWPSCDGEEGMAQL